MFLVLSVKNPQILKVIFEVMDTANSGDFVVNNDQRVVLQPIHSSDDSFTDGWVESTVTVRTALGKITGNPGEFVAQYVQDEQIHDMRYLSSLGYTSLGTATDVAFVHNTDSEVFIIGEGSRSAIYTLICDVLGQGVFDLGIDKEDVLFYESEFQDYLMWHQSKKDLPISVVETWDWMNRKVLQYALPNAMAISTLAKVVVVDGAGYVETSDGYYNGSSIDQTGLDAADVAEIEAAKAEIDALEAKCQAIINKHARW